MAKSHVKGFVWINFCIRAYMTRKWKG